MMDLKITYDLFENFECFKHLNDDDKFVLARHTEFIRTEKNKDIFAAGEMCKKLYFLTKGSVKIHTIDSDNGKEHINSIEHKYNIFGECCLFGMPSKNFNAVTLDEDTRFFAVEVDVFLALMKSNFAFNLAVIQMIGNKIRKSNERLIDFATKDARSRIVEFLKDNAEEVGKQVGYETLVRHGLTQQDIATYTGTSRQTVTTVLNDLKKTNQIYLRRKSILIRDLESLN
jgi:CRP-like cAMP-binding protein